MVRRRYLPFLFIPLFLFFTRCAQVVPLSGGARDTKPPELVSVSPADRSTSLSTKKLSIVFKFNEIISLQNVSQKLIINPLTSEMPEVSASGKTLTVSFEKELQANTTYFSQFGNAVVDIHENNPFSNLSYMFSTGPALDTAYITGKLVYAQTDKLAADVTVMLYRNLADSAPLNSGPDYITRSDMNGEYYLSAVKPGPYKVIAVADKNKNRVYDPSEAVGFPGKAIDVDADTVDMRLSAGKSEKVFIRKKLQNFWGYNKYTLSDTLPNAYIITEKSIDTDLYQYEMRNDTLEVYYKGLEARDLTFVLKNESRAYDTVRIDIPEKAKVDSSLNRVLRKIGVRVEKGTYSVEHEDIVLNFSVPVRKIAAEKTVLLYDKQQETPKFSSEKSNEEGKLVTRYYPLYKRKLANRLSSQKEYKLLLYPGAVETFWGTPNTDTLNVTFKTAAKDELGSLSVKLSLPDTIKSYALELLSEKGTVMREASGANKKDLLVRFYNLPAGDYLLRLTDDKDQNGKFSAGRYLENRQPEPVYFYDKTVKIPAGWDVEAEWTIISSRKK